MPSPRRPGRCVAFWRSFRENRGAVIGLAVVISVVFIAIFADFIAPYSPIEQYRGFTRLPPAWIDGGNWAHPLGTDPVGRDMLSRILYGSRISLFIGLSVMFVSAVLGVLLGLLAAFWGGIVDVIIIRVMDLILAIPSLVLAILIIAVIGPNLTNTIVAVTIVGLPFYVRLVRASAISELTKDYVTAAKVAGVGPLRLMLVDRAAQLHRPAHRAGRTWHIRCDPGRCGPRLPWARRPAAHPGMGFHAGRFPRSHHLQPLGHGHARPCHPDHRSCHQPHGRRPARRTRSPPEKELRRCPTPSSTRSVPLPPHSWALSPGISPRATTASARRAERVAQRQAEERLRDQRVLDIVVALHSEILAGIVANRRQLSKEDAEYAMAQETPFATADDTDFVFELGEG